MLTRKQQELLQFMHQSLQHDDVPPSFDEMKLALGLKSKSGIHRLISGLEERGFIRRMPHRARAVEIVKLPPSMTTSSAAPAPAVVANATSAPSASSTAPVIIEHSPIVQVPFYGRMGANIPLSRLREPVENMAWSSHLAPKTQCLAFEMIGEYMTGAGIQSGDFVLVEKCDRVDNGTIALVCIDQATVTLRIYRKMGPNIVLEPANKVYVSTTYPAPRVQILGRLVSLKRHYQYKNDGQ